MLELEIARAPPTIQSARERAAQACTFTVLDLKSEIFWENLKIHAGGDDKLRIQFAPPKHFLLNCK